MIDLSGADTKWWPSLWGKTAAILASGPSLTVEQCDTVAERGWYTVAINETWRRARWADALYACDWGWWAERTPTAAQFMGLRIIGHLPAKSGKPFVPQVLKPIAGGLHYLPVDVKDSSLKWRGVGVGSGNNGSFQALNWVLRCGAARVVFLGLDLHSPGAHWHEQHKHTTAVFAHESDLRRWRERFDATVEDLKMRKREVINCTPGTALEAFPRVALDKVV